MAGTSSESCAFRIPVPLIREMDAVILKGIGGYATRAEFIVDAIQERILELSVEASRTPDAPPAARSSTRRRSGDRPRDPQASPTSSKAGLPMTALSAPVRRLHRLASEDDLSRPEGRRLFGLHNRDYPSLWALAKLASLTVEQPIPIEDFFARCSRRRGSSVSCSSPSRSTPASSAPRCSRPTPRSASPPRWDSAPSPSATTASAVTPTRPAGRCSSGA